MKVSVDRRVCMGAGSCKQLAPEVFDQNEEDGIVVLLAEVPASGLEAAVRKAAKCCPSGAIRVVEEPV